MPKRRKVILTLAVHRKSGRGVLRGIARYSSLHEPWVFESEPPFYRKYPFAVSSGGHDRALARIKGTDADGVIAFVRDKTQVEAVIPKGLPVVVLPIEDSVPGYCSVVEERYSVGQMAAEHLLDRCYRRFAFCGLDRSYHSRIRQEGFIRTLAEAGIEVDLYPFRKTSGRTSWGVEQRRMADWLGSLPKPIGLMAFNDERAQQVLEAGKLAEVRFPDEIALIGVDNDDIICDLSDPPLSSVSMNFEEIGYEAARQLHIQMDGGAPSTMEVLQQPTHIVTRRSTDILAIEDKVVSEALRFIRSHDHRMISVEDVVNAVSASRRLLERHFQQTLGRSVHREIQRAHIKRACEILVRTDWPLRQVAEHSGFSSPVHFGVVFKRVMNLTPQQYRDRNTSVSGGAPVLGNVAKPMNSNGDRSRNGVKR